MLSPLKILAPIAVFAESNPDCGRRFVLQSHLRIHHELCRASRALTAPVKGSMNDHVFETHIQFLMEPPSPIGHYHDIVNDACPPMEWIQEQRDWKRKHSKKGKRSNSKNNVGSSTSDSEQTENRRDAVGDAGADTNARRHRKGIRVGKQQGIPMGNSQQMDGDIVFEPMVRRKKEH